MKKRMLITLALLAFAMGTSFATTTILVNHSGTTTTYTTLPTALAAIAAGDTMTITHCTDGPMLMGPNNTALAKTFPSWCTVTCTDPTTMATILIPTGNGGNNSFGTADHIHLSNLIIDGQQVGTTGNGPDGKRACACAIGTCGAVSTFNNVVIKGCWWNSVNCNDASGNGTTKVQDDGCTWTNCLIIATGTCMGLDDSWQGAWPCINHQTLNHCTLVGINGAECINFSSACDGNPINQHLRLTNSILSDRQGAVGIVFAGSSPAKASDVDENHNLFDCFWNQIYSQGGGFQGAPAGAGDIVYDYRKLFATPPTAKEYFASYPVASNGAIVANSMPSENFKLPFWAASDIAYAAGNDGKNLGYDDAITMPVGISAFSVQ